MISCAFCSLLLSRTAIDPLHSGANPDFSASELLYQVQATHTRILLVHPDALETALVVAKEANIPQSWIVLFNKTGTSEASAGSAHASFITVDELVVYGRRVTLGFKEKKLAKGEGKTKLAFLSFSSGTTGKPKVRPSP